MEGVRRKPGKTDSFTYDPRNPVPTHGGAVCCDPKIFPWGPDGSASGGEADGCAGVYQRAIEAGPGSDRADSRGAVRVDVGAGYGFHGQAGGRVSERGGAQSDGRHAADRAIGDGLDKGGAGASRAKVYPLDDRCRRDQQCVSAGALDSGGDFEQQFSALRPQSEHGPRRRGRDRAEEGAQTVYHGGNVSVAGGAAGGSGAGSVREGAVGGIDFAAGPRYGAKGSPVRSLTLPAR